MTQPVRPDDIKFKRIPDEVIEVFNDLIAESYNGRRAIVRIDTAAKRIADRLNIEIETVYKLGYFDIEGLYEKAVARYERTIRRTGTKRALHVCEKFGLPILQTKLPF